MNLPAHVDDDVILDELLRLSQPVKVWQDELVNLMKAYIIKDDFLHTMRFFSHVIQISLNALDHSNRQHQSGHNPRKRNKPTFINFDEHLMPKVLNMDRWKRLLIALGFEIEEPDGYHKREDMSIALSDGIMRVVLEGMLLLLKNLQEIPWQYLTMLVRLSRDEALSLDAMLQSTSGPVPSQEEAKHLYDKYPCEMKQLGFQKENKQLERKTPKNTHLHIVIKGLFQGMPPDGDTFV